MPYTTVITFSAGNALAAADLNSNFGNLDYLNAKINEEIQVGAGSMRPSITNGAAIADAEMTTNKNNYTFMDFSDSGGKLYAEFDFILPSDYNASTITYKVHWTANSTSTNSAVFGLQLVAIADDGTLDVAWGTAQEVTDANKSTAYDLNISPASSALTIAGTPAAGERVSCRFYRDSGNGSDTLAATARVLGIVISYTRS